MVGKFKNSLLSYCSSFCSFKTFTVHTQTGCIMFSYLLKIPLTVVCSFFSFFSKTAGPYFHGNLGNVANQLPSMSSWSNIIITSEKWNNLHRRWGCTVNGSAGRRIIRRSLYLAMMRNGGEWRRGSTPNWPFHLPYIRTATASVTLCRLKWDWFCEKINRALRHSSGRYAIVCHQGSFRKDDRLSHW